jgi:hypothetical protein
MASQQLAPVSRCQELDSSIDHSWRCTAGSRLTISKRIVSCVFSFKVGGSFLRGKDLIHNGFKTVKKLNFRNDNDWEGHEFTRAVELLKCVAL